MLEVLFRFRLGKFACVADLSKCFFQVKIPESQQDLLMSCNSFSDLQTIALERVDLFGSRGFKLRKWIANCHAKGILSAIPKCDLAACLEVKIGSDPLPDSGAH